MKIVAMERRAGKTTLAIQRAHAMDAYIVCATQAMARHTFAQAKRMGLEIRFPITHETFLRGMFCGTGCRALIIDDIDMLLTTLSRGIHVDMVTVTSGSSSEGTE